jgi:OPA family glycerol-3-phosphate transporter-like MFS transporter
MGFSYVRELDEYPTGSRRIKILTMAVLAILIGSYESQIAPVVPLLEHDLHMSLTTYGLISAVAVLIGGVAGMLGGRLVDNVGRVRLLIPLMLITSLCCFGMTLVHNEGHLLIARIVLGFVDGMAMAGTAPLVRDFAPRLGRAQAFGFWTWGPVGANFMAAMIASLTLPLFHDSWRSQFVIMGCISLVISIVIAFNIADLSPELRARIQKTEQVALGAADMQAPMRARELFSKLHIWAHVIAISLWLIQYMTLTLLGQTMLVDSFGITTAKASSIMAGFWVLDLAVLIIVGRVSDKLQLRKPFSLAGTIAAVIVMIYFISLMGQKTAPVTELMICGALLGGTLAFAYAPWMANYSENAEDVDPRLQGTAWGVFAFITKFIAFLVLIAAPMVVGATGSWQPWLYVCLAGLVLFIPAVFMFHGPWRRTAVPVTVEPVAAAAPAEVGD